MIHGIGTDIVSVNRLLFLENNGPEDPFVQNTFTEAEIELIESRRRPLFSYATRFAAKEAVFKALGVSGDAVLLSEIEILEDENGGPVVQLYGNALTHMETVGIQKIHVSVSFETEMATAFAVAER